MLGPMLPLFATGGNVPALFVLILALAFDAVFGDPPALWRRIPHPVALVGRLIDRLDRRLNRPKRSDWDRRMRGALVATGLTLAAVAVGIAVTSLRRHVAWGWLVEALLASTLLAQHSLYRHVRDVAVALDRGGLAEGRLAVGRIVGRDPDSLDEAGVARAAIESLAENFADAVVAPVLWYVLFGFPGLLALKTVNTLDSMIGHPDERHGAFGMVSARLDDAMMLAPARLAALLLVLATLFVPGTRPLAAWRTMIADHGHHRSPNSGWPEAAAAGAMGLALAGPRRYPGHVADDPWIGSGRAQATSTDIRRALSLLAVACLLNAGLVVTLLVATL